MVVASGHVPCFRSGETATFHPAWTVYGIRAQMEGALTLTGDGIRTFPIVQLVEESINQMPIRYAMLFGRKS